MCDYSVERIEYLTLGEERRYPLPLGTRGDAWHSDASWHAQKGDARAFRVRRGLFPLQTLWSQLAPLPDVL